MEKKNSVTIKNANSYELGGLFVKSSPLLVRALISEIIKSDSKVNPLSLARDTAIFLAHTLQLEATKDKKVKDKYVRMNAEMPIDDLTNKKRLAMPSTYENSFEQNTCLTKRQQMRARKILVQFSLVEIDRAAHFGRIGVLPNRKNIDALLEAQFLKETHGVVGYEIESELLESDVNEEELIDLKNITLVKTDQNSIAEDKIVIKGKTLKLDINGVIEPDKFNDIDVRNYKILNEFGGSIIQEAVKLVKEEGNDPQISKVLSKARHVTKDQSHSKAVSNGFKNQKASVLLEPEQKVDYQRNVKEI